MDPNTFIFIFSIFIFSIGIIMFVFMSREFSRMSEKKFPGGKEGGPRAELFHAMYEMLSAEERKSQPTSSSNVEPQESSEKSV
jgi:hypothetical protein